GLLYLRRFYATGLVVATIGAGLLGVSTFAALTAVNYSVQVQKEDWRGAMVYVQDHLRLRDEIVVFPGYLATAVDVYYRPGGTAAVPHVPVHAVPSLSVKNFGQRELETELRRVIKCQERAWLVLSPVRARQEDPDNSVEQWFAGGNWHVFDRKEFNGITVYGISFNGQPDCWYPNPDFVELHRYENGLTFLGYIYELRGDSSSQPDASYFPLTTYWRTEDRLPTDYTIRIKVMDKSGKIVADEALGPLNGYWPTSQWKAPSEVIDYRDLRLPGGLATGDYTVSVQLYAGGDGENPLKLTNGATEIVLKQPLRIVPWTP
ncbi:MAG TPA: hypothetical protein VM409_03310, partial [Chloroflexia bacterium]|nr:hypothetical protein [Chloroflexia bacterium]